MNRNRQSRKRTVRVHFPEDVENDAPEPRPDDSESPAAPTGLPNLDFEDLADLKLLKMAVGREWPMPPEIRVEVVRKMHQGLDSGNAWLAIACAEVLIKADAINAKREATAAKGKGGGKTQVKIGSVNLSNLTLDELRTLRSLRAKIAGAGTLPASDGGGDVAPGGQPQ